MEQLHGTTSAKSVNNFDYSENEELMTSNEIAGTPFVIVKSKEGYFVAMGRMRLSGVCETEEIAISLIEQKDWELLFNMVIAATQLTINKIENDKK